LIFHKAYPRGEEMFSLPLFFYIFLDFQRFYTPQAMLDTVKQDILYIFLCLCYNNGI